jgi:hypothetical protein
LKLKGNKGQVDPISIRQVLDWSGLSNVWSGETMTDRLWPGVII